MPIKATYWESADHILDALEQIPQKHLSISARVIMVVVGPLMFVLMYYANQDRGAAVFGLVVYLIFIYLSAFCRPLRRWQSRRHITKHFRRDPLPVEWAFDDADVILRSGSESTSRFAWQHFTRVIQKSRGFLLETKNKQFHWIPRQSLSPDNAFDSLAQLLRQKIKCYEPREEKAAN